MYVYVCVSMWVSEYVCWCKVYVQIHKQNNPNHFSFEAPKTARPAFPVSSIALDNTYGSDISKAGRIRLQLMEEAAEWEEAVQRIV